MCLGFPPNQVRTAFHLSPVLCLPASLVQPPRSQGEGSGGQAVGEIAGN